MGRPEYDFEARSFRAASAGYATKSIDEIFTQNKSRSINKDMDPKDVKIREARDSENHPNSVPIMLALDVTSSMGHIPHFLVKEGLPKIMSGIITKGIPDPQILFTLISDTYANNYPLQIGQFESGDQELDMWLTKGYLEGGGGDRAECYALAYYFAGYHTVTDSMEKRKQKGFLFTIGDADAHDMLRKSEMSKIMGTSCMMQEDESIQSLLKRAQETYNVYHLHIMEGSSGRSSLNYWKQLLGDNCIQIDHHEKVAAAISRIVTEEQGEASTSAPKFTPEPAFEDEEIL